MLRQRFGGRLAPPLEGFAYRFTIWLPVQAKGRPVFFQAHRRVLCDLLNTCFGGFSQSHLEVAPAWVPWDKFPFAESITHVARGIGAARSGDAARARESVTRLAALHAAAVAAKIAYWPDQIEIQRREAAAWLAMAEGRKDEAVALMKEAVALEDATDKHPVTTGAVLPAREMYGDLLMALGRPVDALAEYEASLAVAPNRFYALGAAVRAADAAGRRDTARAHFRTLEKVTARADGTRAEFGKLRAIATGQK